MMNMRRSIKTIYEVSKTKEKLAEASKSAKKEKGKRKENR